MPDSHELISCIPIVPTTIKRFRNTEAANIILPDKLIIIRRNTKESSGMKRQSNN